MIKNTKNSNLPISIKIIVSILENRGRKAQVFPGPAMRKANPTLLILQAVRPMAVSISRPLKMYMVLAIEETITIIQKKTYTLFVAPGLCSTELLPILTCFIRFGL